MIFFKKHCVLQAVLTTVVTTNTVFITKILNIFLINIRIFVMLSMRLKQKNMKILL